jgi:DNA-binding LytR/AlgR family response regulator
MLEKLSPGKFKRIHRSYVVAMSKIKSIANKKVKLTSVELPVSDSYADFMNDLRR